MKVLFIEPPFQSDIQSTLGLSGIPSVAYLASIVEGEDHEVKIIDSPTVDYDLKDVEREIDKFDPEIVGISSTTPAIHDAYRVAEVAKKLDPSCTTVVGGPHSTFSAKEIIEECPYMDIAVRGEGEETIKEIVSGKGLENIKGITYRNGDKVVEKVDRPIIKDLDSLPFPAYHLLPMDEYRFGSERYASMVTSRGCPFKCIFCSSSGICGKIWRGKSPQRVLEQIKLLMNEYDVGEIEMLDDTFVLNKKRAEKICDLIIEERIGLSWSCSSRVDTITKSLIKKLKEAGCHTIYMGIESGTQKILDRLKKGITLERAKKTVKWVKEAGLNPVGSFVLGVFDETKRQMNKTIEFAKELDLTAAQFTLMTPYPGTEAYEIAEENDLLLTKDWSEYDTINPVMKLSMISAKDLKKMLRRAYFKFYARPSYIWKSIKEGRIWAFLKLL